MALVLSLSGCGGGTAAIVGSGGSTGGGGPGASVSEVTVTDTKVSPARIRFTLRGGKAVDVTVAYVPPPEGGEEVVVIAELDGLPASKAGTVHEVDWAFADDPGLGPGATPGLVVRVTLGNGSSAQTSDPTLSVGNDPPRILDLQVPDPATEVVGIVDLPFTVADTDELVDVRVEVNVDEAGGYPASAWALALPGGLPPGASPPDPSVPDVLAVPGGTPRVFFWDVVGQFGALDSGVRLRVTATDRDDAGRPLAEDVVEAGPFRVDNNAPPVVALDDAGFLLGDDQRLGIVVPYTLSDAEGDDLDLVFQWAADGEPFPELPADEAALAAVLADPLARAAHQVASPYPAPAGGRVVPDGPDTVELPELASSQAHLLRIGDPGAGDPSRALDGYRLELLRPAVPRAARAAWTSDPLDGPVAALAGAGGTSALVLDGAGTGGSRLRELDLATGAVLTELATTDGEPDTLAFEPGGGAVLLADHVPAGWRLHRVVPGTGEVTLLADVAAPGDEVRGVASLGTGVALVTVGDALLRLDVSQPPDPVVVTLVDGLAAPWGVLVDPVRPHRVHLAERDGPGGGRLLSVALDSGAVDELVVDPPGVSRPTALATEQGGRRLLVLTDETPGDGLRELLAVEPGTAARAVVRADLPDTTVGLATGRDGLRLLSLGAADDLAVGGGVVQRRTIVDYDRTRRVVTVEPAFAPLPWSGQAWRVAPPETVSLAPGVTRRGTFVWDSRDLPAGHGRGRLRLVARDADEVVAEHDGGKPVLSGLLGEPQLVGATSINDVVAADVDGDGAADLVVTPTTGTLDVHLQTAPGVFDPEPLRLDADDPIPGPRWVAVDDLDGDGRADIATTNQLDNSVTVYFQTAPLAFAEPPLVLGGPPVVGAPRSLVAADVDGDGLSDLALTSVDGIERPIVVFFQTAPGRFDPSPLVLGDADPAFEVVVADVDGDGDKDLVGSALDAGVVLALQTAPRVFDVVFLRTPGARGDFTLGVDVGDLDGDGDLDVAAAETSTGPAGFGRSVVFFQSCPGRFEGPPLVFDGPSTATTGTVEVLDVDGDGDHDIVTRFLDALVVLVQQGPGEFARSLLEPDGGGWSLVDVDGDGALDLVSQDVGQGSDASGVAFGTGAGDFDPDPQVLGGPAITAFVQSVAVADLDGDGRQDVVAANRSGNRLTVWSQVQAGALELSHVLATSERLVVAGPTSVAAADLDGDGSPDLVAANQFTDDLALLFQTAPGSFDPRPRLLGGPGVTDRPFHVDVGDLDGDGDLDVASANVDGDDLTVFLQQAPGVFDPVPLVLGDPSTTDGPVWVEVTDVDGDGLRDLASANQAGDTLAVFFQTAPGAFAPVSVGGSATTDGARSVAVADVDGDGLLDLVSANVLGDTLTTFFQTAPRVFDPQPLTLGDASLTEEPQSVAAADVDRDGDLDLVSANLASNSYTVFFQTGPVVFDPVPVSLVAPLDINAPRHAVVADLDGDGDPEIVGANQFSQNVVYFTNAHLP